MIDKLKIVLPVVVVGQVVTLLLAIGLSAGTELGALFIVPIVIILGTLIQLIIIFIKIKGTLTTKIIYTLLSLLLSVVLFSSISFILNFANRGNARNSEIFKNCSAQWSNFEQESGLSKIASTDPKYKQIVQQANKIEDDCLRTNGYKGTINRIQ